jgi:uncharacterized integral membrane protein
VADNDREDQTNVARLVVALILVALLVAFAIDNSHSVKVGFVFTEKKIPLIFVLIGTVIVGAVLDRIARFSRRH